VDIVNFHDPIQALGTALAKESVDITAQVTARVTKILFEDGQDVKAGDVLVTLDRSELTADLKSLTAQLAESRSAYARAQNLAARKVISVETLEERRSSLRQVEAEIEALKARLKQRQIVAPFTGRLGLRSISMGALLQPGQIVTQINDSSEVRLDFDLAAVHLSVLHPGLAIVAQSASYRGTIFHGTVSSLDNHIDPVTRTVKVRARLPNEDRLLKPGMLLTLALKANARQALVVPEESILLRGAKSYVYRLTQPPQTDSDTPSPDPSWRAVLHEIIPGKRQAGQVEILSGLKPGDKIVWHGVVKVKDGRPVQILDSDDGFASLKQKAK